MLRSGGAYFADALPFSLCLRPPPPPALQSTHPFVLDIVYSIEVLCAFLLFTPFKAFASIVLFGLMSSIMLTHVREPFFCLPNRGMTLRLRPSCCTPPPAPPLPPSFAVQECSHLATVRVSYTRIEHTCTVHWVVMSPHALITSPVLRYDGKSA